MPQTYSEKKRAGVRSRTVEIAHSPAAAYLIVRETLFRALFGLSSSA